MKKSIILLTLLIIIGIVLVLVGLTIKKSDRQIIIAAEYPIQGYRISPPLSLDEIKNVASSSIKWEATIPDGTRITIKAATTTDGENPLGFGDPRWQKVEQSGDSIPGIEPGANLTGQYLWTMQILETDDPDITPQLHSLTETIRMEARTEGYRISPVFDFSGPNTVKDSQIFWQANERFDGTVNVEVSYDGGSTWSDEPIANGASIPGLEPGTSLSGVKIQTKTSFVGGPDFYPSLENIKIFIELE
jgi:hypothetical protein